MKLLYSFKVYGGGPSSLCSPLTINDDFQPDVKTNYMYMKKTFLLFGMHLTNSLIINCTYFIFQKLFLQLLFSLKHFYIHEKLDFISQKNQNG